MNEERRTVPRVNLEQCVRVSFGRETFIGADVLNLSRKGMLCSSDVPVENLERIFLMINLPFTGETKTIQCEGVVLYTQPKDDKTLFGIQFTDIRDADCKTLESYLDLIAFA